MAITISELTSNYDPTDATSYTTASITPAANSLLYLPYSTRHGTTGPGITPSGGGLTWTVIEAVQADGGSAIGSWQAQCGASPGSFVIGLSVDGGVTATGCAWHVLQVAGHDTSTPIVQSPIAGTGNTGTTATVTFSTLGNASNAQILHAAHRANEAQAAEAGWTAGNLTRFNSGPTHSSAVTWKIAAADLSATQTWATSSRWQAQGVEILLAGATTPVTGTMASTLAGFTSTSAVTAAPEAIVHIGSGITSSTATTSLAAVWPAGYVSLADDLAHLHVMQTGSNSAITTPASWTLLKRTQRSTTHVAALYERKLGAGTGVPTVVVGSSSGLVLTTHIYRNVDPTVADDTAVQSVTGTNAAGITGPDVGVCTTAAAAIITYCCTDLLEAVEVNGISVTDDPALDPYTAIDGPTGQRAAANGGDGGVAVAYHHCPLPKQTDRTRVHSFTPNFGFLSLGGWIATSIALRPLNPTVAPVPRGLHGAVIQQPLPSVGADCSPLDPFNVQLAIQAFNPTDGGGGKWDLASWDLAQWSGPGRWKDVTIRTRGASWNVGAEQPGDRPRIGTGLLELANTDGLVSPWATAGEFTDGAQSWLRSGCLMRICFNSTTVDLATQYGRAIFTGHIESVETDSESFADAWIQIALVDPLSRLATYNGIEQAEQGGGEGLFARLTRLLNDAGWPYSYGLGSGEVPAHATNATFIGTTLAGERLAEVYLLGDSAGVNIYAHNNGSILVNNPKAGAPTLTFSNAPAGGEHPYVTAKPYADTARILNAAIAARKDGHEIEVDDGPSVSRFGRIDTGNGWPRRDLICQSDVTVTAIVNAVLAARGHDDQGIASLEMDCDQEPASLYSNLAFLRLFENVIAKYHHPMIQELTLTQSSYVEGMSHKVTKEGDSMKWTATLSLAKYPS